MRFSCRRGLSRRLWQILKDSRGLINTTDLMVASGAAIILALGVAVVATEGMDQAKLGKAQPDAVAIATAMSAFFKDTGRWPGQAEITDGSSVKFLITGDPSKIGDTAKVPDKTATKVATGNATCKGMSLEGAVGKTFTAANAADKTKLLSISDYLILKPAEAKYPNWKGPYLPADIRSDPFDRVWVINVMPLFCAEELADSSDTGSLGFAWILSGGPNQTITTGIGTAKLDPEGDDAGVNLGKLTQRAPGGRNN